MRWPFPGAPLRKKYDLRRTGLAVRLVQNGACLQQKTVLFDQEKRLQLPGAKLHTKVEIQKDQLCLTVTTDRFARLVHLESSRTSLPFSDNYFDLLPGQSHTVTLAVEPDCTLRQLAESIRVKSLSDVPLIGIRCTQRPSGSRCICRPSTLPMPFTTAS